MKTKVLLQLLLSTLVLFNFGCTDNTDSGPQQIICGKWEIIAEGYYDFEKKIVISPRESNGNYIEYFPNGEMWRPRNVDGEVIMAEYPYRLESEFLYENYEDKENTYVYKYKFDKNNEELTLEIIKGNLSDIYPQIVIGIYKRINE
jgi:hypothetical protein